MDPGSVREPYAFLAAFYDDIAPYRERQDVPFFVEVARASGGAVLELGCGTGRVLVPIARAGVEIDGLDLSAAMLGVCREKLSREPEEVRSRTHLHEGDMRRFDLGKRFRLVTVPFRGFQHLVAVEDQIAALSSIQRHLADGGTLILDVFNPSLQILTDDRLLSEFGEEPEVALPDGRRVVRSFRFASRDLCGQAPELEMIFRVTHPDGRNERVVDSFRMRYFFRFEAEHLLARCGFRVEEVYSDYDRSPYGAKYPGELIFVARRA